MGAFADERVELLRGTLVEMSPNDPAHASPLALLGELLILALARRAHVRIQLPLVAADDSEPEPDLAIVPLADYSTAHPTTALLVVEISNSSLRKDRLVKGPIYAASGFQEYWIVDVDAKVVEVHRAPSGDGWRSVTRHGREETLSPEAFPDVRVTVADFLG
jgi:Uma2 family endonuclease